MEAGMEDYIQKIRESARLISLPKIYYRLKALLDDPDYTMAELALLIGTDPGMSARFLRIVNSALYRRAAKIETVSHAVSLLGSKQVHQIVLGASIAEAFKGIKADVMNMRQFWQRSVYCALTVQHLAEGNKDLERERMFMIGLLHDIGHLFMYLGIPEKAQEALLKAKKENRPPYLVERELLGFDFANLAGLMMAEWKLPESLRIPVTFHPEPATTVQFPMETALLHLASLLVRSDQEGGGFGTGAFSVDAAAWQLSGMTQQHCLETRKRAATEFSSLADSIFS